jgi:hypothetical protein
MTSGWHHWYCFLPQTSQFFVFAVIDSGVRQHFLITFVFVIHCIKFEVLLIRVYF